jgi:stage II sporulation protein E
MRVFLAVEDKGGRIISSPEVRGALTEALRAVLCDIEYYRDGEVSMLECCVGERYSVSFAYRIKAGEGDISGDSAVGIRTSDGAFYGILADGMGRGAIAHAVSDHLISITKNLLSFGITESTLVKFLSCLMSRHGEAHSTLDIFRLDLYTGEGAFIKCGAAPSYIKRGGTIYRIGSEGTPIGAGSEALGERIRAEVRVGDTVVMTSDGVVDTRSAQLKFIERMSGEIGDTLSAFAEELVAPTDENGDDRSALVIRIEERSKIEAKA